MHLTLPTWAAWKSTVITTKGLMVQYGETPTTYELAACEDGILWVYSLLKNGEADVLDFEGTVQATANRRRFDLTSIGLPAFVNLDFPEQASDMMKSWQLTTQPQSVEILDIGIMNDLVGSTGVCYLAGGEYRMRTAAAEGSALNFMVVDRDDVLGYFPYYGMSRSRLTGLTGITGTFQVGEIVIGGTSGCRAYVLGVSGTTLYITFWRWDSNDRPSTFTAVETVTGQTSGAVAILAATPFTEGDVLPLKAYVKDEWVEGYDVREVRPGGSKQLPKGLYFRVVLYNAHATEALRAKVSLILATS